MPPPESACTIADEVPWSDHVTDYDRAHFIVYLRLLGWRDSRARAIDEIVPRQS